MEVEQVVPPAVPMTFDEVSMERSKNFVNALQELKNLRPQLYSAAEYCEKSYLHSEQKQMVVDNLKDYTVRALVNAVDHLGTVASKLTDLFEQQNCDISTMELKVSSINQKILTWHTFKEKEGLRQQRLLAIIPKHHKHYILPNSVSKRVHFSPHKQPDFRQNHSQVRSLLQPSDAPASKSLSWHLGAANKSTLKGSSSYTQSFEDSKASAKVTGAFHLLDTEDMVKKKQSFDPSQLSCGSPASNTMMKAYGITHKDLEGPKHIIGHKAAVENPRQEIIRAPIRNKSLLSAFFVKQKTPKLKAGYVS